MAARTSRTTRPPLSPAAAYSRGLHEADVHSPSASGAGLRYVPADIPPVSAQAESGPRLCRAGGLPGAGLSGPEHLGVRLHVARASDASARLQSPSCRGEYSVQRLLSLRGWRDRTNTDRRLGSWLCLRSRRGATGDAALLRRKGFG